jgi:hypothetical protein
MLEIDRGLFLRELADGRVKTEIFEKALRIAIPVGCSIGVFRFLSALNVEVTKISLKHIAAALGHPNDTAVKQAIKSLSEIGLLHTELAEVGSQRTLFWHVKDGYVHLRGPGVDWIHFVVREEDYFKTDDAVGCEKQIALVRLSSAFPNPTKIWLKLLQIRNEENQTFVDRNGIARSLGATIPHTRAWVDKLYSLNLIQERFRCTTLQRALVLGAATHSEVNLRCYLGDTEVEDGVALIPVETFLAVQDEERKAQT